MGFLSFNLDYYETTLAELEATDPSHGNVLLAKRLLKIICDLEAEGYSELKELLERELSALSRLREYILKSGETPFSLGDATLKKEGLSLSYSESETELNLAIKKAADMARLSYPARGCPFISELARFSDWVGYKDGTAYVFLLRDTLLPYIYFCEKGRTRIYPWLLGRSALELVSGVKNIDDELRKPIYAALENGVNDFGEFKNAVLPEMRKTISKYSKLESFLLNLLGSIREQKIVAVESGVCGTFPLMLMSLDSRVDFMMYTTYPYLYELYNGRVYTDEYEKNRDFESLLSQDLMFELSDIRDGEFYVKMCETDDVLTESLREIGAIMKA